MRLSAVLVGGLVAAGLAAVSLSSAIGKTDKAFGEAKKNPPMEFFIATGGPDACGLGCNSWVAAEGVIDDGASGRLRRVLDQLGSRKLPVFFYSPGGDAMESLAIGRMLRKRGLTAGVAVTVRADCLPAKQVEECRELLRLPQRPEAALLMDGASCDSACAYAVLGAAKREISPTALLGVHSGHSYLSWASPEITQSQRARIVERGERRIAREVQRYIAEMGIDSDLYRIISETSFNSLHILTRAELFALGIDRREVVDSGWHFSDLPSSSIGSSMLMTVAENEGSTSTDFRQMVLAVSCGEARSETYTVSAIARLPDAATGASKRNIRLGKEAMNIWLPADSAAERTSNGKVYEIRRATWPRPLVEKLLLAAPVIAFVGPLRVEASVQSDGIASTQIQRPLSGVAVEASLRTLAGRCDQAK